MVVLNDSINFGLLLCLIVRVSMAQTVSLQVSSTTGTAGATVPLAVTLNTTSGMALAALQWDLAATPGIQGVNITIGAFSSAAGKSLSCSGSRCIVAGLNTTTIPNGVVATLNITLSANASGNVGVQLSNIMGTAANASAISVSSSPGTISL